MRQMYKAHGPACQLLRGVTLPLCVRVCVHVLHTHVHTHMHIHMHTHTCTHTHAHTRTHMHTPTHTHMHTCTHMRCTKSQATAAIYGRLSFTLMSSCARALLSRAGPSLVITRQYFISFLVSCVLIHVPCYNCFLISMIIIIQ